MDTRDFSLQAGFPVRWLESTTSTNDYLRQYLRTGEAGDFLTVAALYQSAGKGQKGNSWESEAGRNLLFSYVVSPAFLTVKQQFAVSELAALGVRDALGAYAEGVSVKWPNDIYWGDKKLGGMLIEVDVEADRTCRFIVGIGLNVNQLRFTSPAPNPISLRQITGQETDLQVLLGQCLERTARLYRSLAAGTLTAEELHARYKAALYRREGLHAYADAGGEFRAEIADVAADGVLTLRDEGGRLRQYLFKEVRFII